MVSGVLSNFVGGKRKNLGGFILNRRFCIRSEVFEKGPILNIVVASDAILVDLGVSRRYQEVEWVMERLEAKM